MDATATLVSVFRVSQLAATFPFSVTKSNGVFLFEESKTLLRYTLTVMFLFIPSGIYLFLAEGYIIMYKITTTSSGIVLAMTMASLVLSDLFVFRSTLRKRRTLCHWLNKIPELFTHLKEESVRKVVTIYYSVFAVTLTFILFSVSVEYCLMNFVLKDEVPSVLDIHVSIFSFYIIKLQIKVFIMLFYCFVSLIRFYYADAHDFLSSCGKISNKQFWLRYLRDFRSNDLDLKDLVDFLHSYFIPVVSLELLSAFSLFLFCVSMSLMNSGILTKVQLSLAIYMFWDVVLMAFLCHLAEYECDRAIHRLHDFFIHFDDKELKKEIDIISLQLQHRRLEFVSFGCQRLNFSLLYWMAGLLGSYTVIMAQFHIDPNPKSELMRNCSFCWKIKTA